MLRLFQTRDGLIFFIVTLVYTCRVYFIFFFCCFFFFFCCIIRKYLSHILVCSQFGSVCFAMKLSFSFKIHCLQVLQLFQTKDGPIFFHRHTYLHLSCFFCCIIRKYLSHKLFWSQLVSVCFAMKFFFFPLKYTVYKCFRPEMGQFFHRHTCLHLSRFFCCIIRKYLYHTLFWSQFVSVCFALKLFFSFKIHCLQMLQLFQTKNVPVFFIVTLFYTCRAFFCCITRKYLSQLLFWSQLVSVCFAMKFFFSCKIHCLQMFQLFQTKDGPVFFIVTLVYTCRAFFVLSSENICLMYCFGNSSSQSVLQWNSFSPLKYIVAKCFSCFRPGMGQFLSSSHLSTLVFVLLYHQKIFIPYIVLVTARLRLFRNEIFFFPLKYIVYKCFSCFRPEMGQFFSSSHLSRFFRCIIRKNLSHTLFWSQFASVCFAMKLFFSFKIHCLQMLHLFQTRDGPIFFIVTLVTLFFAVSSKTIYPI